MKTPADYFDLTRPNDFHIRTGLKARILAFDGPPNKPIIGLVDDSLYTWFEDGRCDSIKTEWDLLQKPKKTIHINKRVPLEHKDVTVNAWFRFAKDGIIYRICAMDKSGVHLYPRGYYQWNKLYSLGAEIRHMNGSEWKPCWKEVEE